MGFFRACRVCSAPAEVTATVNRALAEKVKLRDIAAQCGISKSSIHRHASKCIAREILAGYKAKVFDSRPKQVVVKWPDDSSCPAELRDRLTDGFQTIPAHQIDAVKDILFVVTYAKAIGRKNACNPSDAARELAHAENAQRQAAKQIPGEVSNNGNGSVK
jgi:hypothetical protein